MRSSPLRDSLPEHAMIPGGAAVGSWPTLLVVDDDPVMLETLVWYFEKRGFHVAASSNLAEAKTFFHRRKNWTLVLSDYHLPDGTGLELCWWMREQVGYSPAFLLMSGSMNCAALCQDVDFLAKPFALETLETRVHGLLGRR
jgi:two-component system alkaline phosphatase synthesis response regulator PhoP